MRIDAMPLRMLTHESLRDAMRRRIVPAVIAISFLTLLVMDSCSTCSTNIVVGGKASSINILNWTGMAAFTVLGLWSIALAGLLAADHLRSIFEDGSAILLLARPVSRPTLALARLLGSLAVSLVATLILCLGATFFLVVRGGLPLAPALFATGAVVLSAIAVAALAMTGSLFMPRIVTVLSVLGGVGLVGVLNIGSASGNAMTGLYWAIDSFGPPLLSSIIVALSPWSGQTIAVASPLAIVLRGVAWAVGSVALLLVVFDQRELAKLEPR